MIARGNEIEIVWTGPYGWPKFESANDLPDEQPIIVKNVCDAKLHALPLYLEV